MASASYVIKAEELAATPTFSLKAGTYTSAQDVSLADSTKDAVIYYTTNGSIPTTSSAKYTGPIKVSATQTLKAAATATGYISSQVASAAYVIKAEELVATPVFSLKAGTYAAAQELTMSDATKGAVIYYTTNGSIPTTSSPKYTGAIKVSATETIKAAATASGYTSSKIASAEYVIKEEELVATPVFSLKAGTYASAQELTMSDATKGAVIYYTTNGSIPTTSSAKYTGAIKISASETVTAAATASGYVSSKIASAEYVIKSEALVATPVFSLKAGTYGSAQELTMSDATKGAVIYYTTNGSIPTTSSAKYTGAIKVSASETVTAAATASGYVSSKMAIAEYVIKSEALVATPVFSLKAGTYGSAQELTMSDATKGAVIYYTTNGSTPTTSSAKYSGAIKVSVTEVIKAAATATGLKSSQIAIANYELKSPVAVAPKYSVGSGMYAETLYISLYPTTTGSVIHYTTNGSTPTASSAKYTAPIKVSASETLKSIAIAPGYTDSAVQSAAYVIETPTAVAKFSIGSGTYTEEKFVSIYPATAGSVIYYTTNGSTPTLSSAKYTSPISVTTTETIKAIAVASEHLASPVITATYKMAIPTAIPTLSVKAGTYSSDISITMKDTYEGRCNLLHDERFNADDLFVAL